MLKEQRNLKTTKEGTTDRTKRDEQVVTADSVSGRVCLPQRVMQLE